MFQRKRFRLRLPSRTLMLGERTLIMGVLNVTPDSFSDGDLFLDTERKTAALFRNWPVCEIQQWSAIACGGLRARGAIPLLKHTDAGRDITACHPA